MINRLFYTTQVLFSPFQPSLRGRNLYVEIGGYEQLFWDCLSLAIPIAIAGKLPQQYQQQQQQLENRLSNSNINSNSAENSAALSILLLMSGLCSISADTFSVHKIAGFYCLMPWCLLNLKAWLSFPNVISPMLKSLQNGASFSPDNSFSCEG